jgi:hypothetical protein
MGGMELTEFLLARIAEDERGARQAQADPHGCHDVLAAYFDDTDKTWRFTHARVLAECEAKRRIVAMAQRFTAMPDDSGTDIVLDDVLRLLALPYADHPDYDEAWKPGS